MAARLGPWWSGPLVCFSEMNKKSRKNAWSVGYEIAFAGRARIPVRGISRTAPLETQKRLRNLLALQDDGHAIIEP